MADGSSKFDEHEQQVEPIPGIEPLPAWLTAQRDPYAWGKVTRADFWSCFDRMPPGLKEKARAVLATLTAAGCDDPSAVRCLDLELAPIVQKQRSVTERRFAVVRLLESWRRDRGVPASLRPSVLLGGIDARLAEVTEAQLEALSAAHSNAAKFAAALSIACCAFGDTDFDRASEVFERAQSNGSRKTKRPSRAKKG